VQNMQIQHVFVSHQLYCYLLEGEGVSVLALNAIDRRFESWSGQIKNYKSGLFADSLFRG
jgi:hypothetical protein